MGQRFRIGAVNFFNTRPLIHGLDEVAGVEVTGRPPAELADLLERGVVDVALTPSIDYQRSEQEWVILPVGSISSLGEVLTVRVFSRVPFEEVSLLRCDVHSHTSVALARLVWRLRYGRAVSVSSYEAGVADGMEADRLAEEGGAVLLIGDKVLGQLGRWPFELDLGQAWTELTGLGFVYAFWAMRRERQALAEGLVRVLGAALARGRGALAELSGRYGGEHGFSAALAERYFREHIQFDFGAAQCAALARFYELAAREGVTGRCRPLRIYGGDDCSALAGKCTGQVLGGPDHD